jgi:hypothetical protein
MATIRKSRAAAITVRRATTAKGLNPRVMASLPKTGDMPRKTAEPSAAKMPAVFFLKEKLSNNLQASCKQKTL